MSRRSPLASLAVVVFAVACALPLAVRAQSPNVPPPSEPNTVPQPLQSLPAATPPGVGEAPTPVSSPTAAPSPVASGCVPDSVRFDPKYAVPAWVDPLHATLAKQYVVHAPKATLRLAVATDTRQRARGLMCVTAIPAHGGMLFAFPNEQRLDFWMKDTLVPLDMIWVRANGVVSTVAANVPSTTPSTPDDDIPRRDGVGKFVIELAAGEAARVGIVKGTKLVLPPVTAH